MSSIPVAPSPSVPPVPEPQSISVFGRLIGVFFSPKATFEDIARKPSWIAPILVMMILGVVSVSALNSHFDWRDYITQQIEKSPRAANLSPEQKQQQIDMSAKFSPTVAYVMGVVMPLLAVLVIAGVLLLAYNVLAGAGISYSASLSVVAHSIFPTVVVGTFLFLLVLFLKPVGAFDLDNPVATNLAALLPESVSKGLVAIGKNIDLLEIWKLLLLGMGFACLNPKKLKGGKSYTIVISVFLVYVLCRAGIAFIFS